MEMNLITFEQAKLIDKKTIEKGVDEKILMGLASQSALISMMHLNLVSKNYLYLFLCGSGNNGGDGLALAYLLAGTPSIDQRQIIIYLKDQPRSESSQFYYQMLLKNQFNIKQLHEFDWNFVNLTKFEKIIVIEALLGTGQKNIVNEFYKKILTKIKLLKIEFKEKIVHLALDLPAGLSEEYENFNEKDYLSFFDLPIPDYIFNFGLKKLVLLHPLIQSKSKIYVLPCGFDPESQQSVLRNQLEFIEWDQKENFEIFNKKPYEHKYQSGYGWLFAGSNNMEGAAILSTKAFFYSGGGILHLIHFSKNRDYFLNADPSVIFHHIEEWKESYQNLKLPNSIVIGPGISNIDIEKYKIYLLKFFNDIVQKKYFPKIILDAFATTLILDESYPKELLPYTIITPHLGEWKQLNGEFPYLVSNWEKIKKMYERLGVSILIKGSISFFMPSLLLKDAKPVVYVWKYQNPHLSVAGSGDVLTGIILSYFSKIKEMNIYNLLEGLKTILTLQNHTAKNHSTAYDQVQNIRKILNQDFY
jgi:NAD(P)H-hydrate repair Nnr-like enzyme with NAD(P)H-hydrate dehydratase domain/NAD(P)H-hydrate repair Nnr-like enzyme with NAD(P)H-hydrate epimerase domain